MTSERKSTDPRDRMGVYDCLADVPPRHRLASYADAYDGRDVWTTFLEEFLFDRYDSPRFKDDVRRAGRYWKTHMDARGRHHALATPADVEAWVADLLETRRVKTVYNSYWVRIERFYRWLQWHTDHPHLYHPVLMAAADGGVARTVWTEKINRR